MPKKTFFNLPESKRQHLLDIAFREFAFNDYHHASISRIVETAEIAKGSIYQYFNDKRDLYFYLLDTASETKLSFISEHLNKEDRAAAAGESAAGFFERHKQIILLGTYFDFTYPRYSLLILNASREPNHPDLGDLARDLKERSAEYLRQFVKAAADANEIRTDIDIDCIVHTVNQITLTLGEYVEKKYTCTLENLLGNPASKPPFTKEQLEGDVDAVIEIIRRGIASPSV